MEPLPVPMAGSWWATAFPIAPRRARPVPATAAEADGVAAAALPVAQGVPATTVEEGAPAPEREVLAQALRDASDEGEWLIKGEPVTAGGLAVAPPLPLSAPVGDAEAAGARGLPGRARDQVVGMQLRAQLGVGSQQGARAGGRHAQLTRQPGVGEHGLALKVGVQIHICAHRLARARPSRVA